MGRTIRKPRNMEYRTAVAERAGLIARVARMEAEEEMMPYLRNAVSANGCRGWSLNAHLKGN